MNTKYSKQLFFRFISVSAVLLLALSQFGGALAQDSATYIVNTTNDVEDGFCNKAHCSLREAITAANAHPGADTIAFNIHGRPPFTIQPLSALPEITESVTIDGTTQRGFAGYPIVELDGTNAGEVVGGLVISAGDSTVRGLVINRFYPGDGIVLTDNGGNTIQGNFLGTDVTGTVALGNYRGVFVTGGSTGNLIGGTGAHAGNLLSGNEGAGIRLSDAGTEGNKVQGNLIGTDLTGMSPLGNGLGVRITEGAAHNLIGGTEAGARNVISGNGGEGVSIDIEEVEVTTGNIVQGNYIGTDANGAAALPNGDGIWIGAGASDTLIGGVDEGAGNLISGNGGDGVSINDSGTTGTVVQGNLIGMDASGTYALPNGADGVRITGGASDTLIGGREDGARNVISGNTYIGVSIWDPGTSDNIIQGNFIGTDASGTAALQNGAEGVAIYSGASKTLIGGTEDGTRNIISSNGSDGVHIADPGTSENNLLGNFIGTDVTGMVALGNSGPGVNVEGGASGNLIGGTGANTGNLISGNRDSGVRIANAGTEGNKVQGNLIGTDINGTGPLGNGYIGIQVTDGAADNLIGGTEDGARNVISDNNESGVTIRGATGNEVQGNFIGTDIKGTSPLGNRDVGIWVLGGATDNEIGGTEDGARNVISGNNFAGVAIAGNGTTGNTVQGNYIGTDRDGSVALANVIGVLIVGDATGNLIGGIEAGARNVISGNPYNVIFSVGGGKTGNTLQGNYIGLDSSGSKALAYTDINVLIFEGATDNLIGGTEDGARNVISGASRYGVAIDGGGTTGNTVQGNYIGTDATGMMPLGNLNGVAIGGSAAGNLIGGMEPGAGNTIAFNTGAGIELGLNDNGINAGSGNALLSNSVYSNGGLGIDLGNDGVTYNDPGDTDTGPNDLQNFPVITAVRRVGRAVMIYGTLESTPSTKFRLEFFSNEACDPSGYGEGQAFLGFSHVKTDQAGMASFIITLPVSLPQEAFVTATATDPGGSTSEFSACFMP
jgi:CSLREA domain-containing protein